MTHPPISTPYSSSALDRVNTRRHDAGWVAATAAAPDARALLLREDRCLTAASQPVESPMASVPTQLRENAVLLGITDQGDGSPLFAIDLSHLSSDAAMQLAGADAQTDVRDLFATLSSTDSATIAHARGLLRWHRHQVFCGACGAPTTATAGGNCRRCTGCGQLHFPRIEPAVITLVETTSQPARCLMARHSASTRGRYSLLAGFVEVGESLEDAVRRELHEEVGIDVQNVRYIASQPWPFPAGIMVAFRATTDSTAITIDHDEIADARWFSRAELEQCTAQDGPPGRLDSVDRILLDQWLADRQEHAAPGADTQPEASPTSTDARRTSTSQGRMTSSTLLRLVISVSSLDRALPFYADVLHLQVASRSGDICALSGSGVEVLLHQQPSDPSDGGVCACFVVDDLDRVVEQVTRLGCEVIDAPAQQPWGEVMSVVRDPDGHIVCLARDA